MTAPDRFLTEARQVFEFLYLRDPVDSADAIFGFGHFDMKVPRRCRELFLEGRGPLVILTGGVGAGTADLGQPEARAFRYEILSLGGVPEDALLVEDASTHTGENLVLSARLLAREGRGLGSDSGVRSALVVANAYRQRRVHQTCRLHYPTVRWLNAPPRTTFDDERAMFREKGQDLVRLVTGELTRLRDYPARGFCAPAEIPGDVLEAHERLEGGLAVP